MTVSSALYLDIPAQQTVYCIMSPWCVKKCPFSAVPLLTLAETRLRSDFVDVSRKYILFFLLLIYLYDFIYDGERCHFKQNIFAGTKINLNQISSFFFLFLQFLWGKKNWTWRVLKETVTETLGGTYHWCYCEAGSILFYSTIVINLCSIVLSMAAIKLSLVTATFFF